MKVIKLFICLLYVLVTSHFTVFAHETDNDGGIYIHVNEEKFEPSTIEVKVGTSVTFENSGREDHWPASDNHPSHSGYDGTTLDQHCNSDRNDSFDSCKAISPNGTWSFTFNKAGTYDYHDHLWPHLKGQIVVTTNDSLESTPPVNTEKPMSILDRIKNFILQLFNKPKATLNSGKATTEFYDSLVIRYQLIVKEKDPREAILELAKDSAADDKISALCHDMLHEIGHTSYKKYGSFKEAAQFQSDFCNSGYIHGLFESYFATTEHPLGGLSDQCKNYAVNRRPFDLWQCYHGIGHGFMYLTGGDLDESLKLCQENLPINDVLSCQNGVYMEVFNSEILAKEKSFVDSANPFATCSTRNIAKADCYMYVPVYLSNSLNMDFADMFNECKKAESRYVYSCVEGIGSEAIKRNMNRAEKVFDLCVNSGSSKFKDICINGVVGMYMNQSGAYEPGAALCMSAADNVKRECTAAAESRKGFFAK
jgi:plastocyanin